MRTWTTLIDQTLLERVGWDELALRRIRRHLMHRFRKLPHTARVRLLEGGIHSRFAFLNLILQESLTPESWQRWVAYLEHSEQDLAEMGRGEYPISPYMIRIYSAAFGIKVDSS